MHLLRKFKLHSSSHAERKNTTERPYSTIASMRILDAQQSQPGGHATAAANASCMMALIVLAQRPHFGEQPRQE
jgi:hypothetical protein